MRYFVLLNEQHIMLYLWPTLAFIVIFALGLAYSHLRGQDSAAREHQLYGTYPDEIQDRDAPFPLALGLIIAGTVLWGVLYVLGTGLWGVKI
ncbi:MAG: hypothetical protein MUP74_01295 [Desulfobacterales bacterium]|nr:hypothetical protein [Desulfobacterales bacterium]